MDVHCSTLFRRPGARPVQAGDGTWWVQLPTSGAVTVLPLGVHPEPWVDPPTERLDQTPHEISEHLAVTATLADGDAAEHLAEHFRNFGGPELCSHGLPLWHQRPARKGGRWSCWLAGVPGSPDGSPGAVSVDSVRRMLTTFDGVRTLHDLARKGQKISPAIVEHALDWPVLAHAGLVRAEAARDGQLTAVRARHVVCNVVTAAMLASALHVSMVWLPNRRPELGLVAETATALYVADLASHVSSFDLDRTFTCQVCGQPFTPQRAPSPRDGLYCRRVECQRARQRRNQARRRTQAKGE